MFSMNCSLTTPMRRYPPATMVVAITVSCLDPLSSTVTLNRWG